MAASLRALLPQGVDQVQHAQHFAPIAHHLSVTRLAPAQDPVAVHHERRAVGHVAVHVVDAVGRDDRARHVAQQGERERVRGAERGVAERAVAADAEDHRPALLEPARRLAQAGELRRSDAAEIVTVEAEHHVAPAKLAEWHWAPLGARQLELGRGLPPLDRRHDAHSADFPRGSQPLRRRRPRRRLATLTSIPYAALAIWTGEREVAPRLTTG